MDPIQFAWMHLDYTPPGLRSVKAAAPGKPAAPGTPGFFSAPFSVPGAIGTPGFLAGETPEDPPSTHSIDPPGDIFTPVETPLPVPEPSTLTLFGLGGAAGVAHYLRKRAKARVGH
jgi:hypothetical protein